MAEKKKDSDSRRIDAALAVFEHARGRDGLLPGELAALLLIIVVDGLGESDYKPVLNRSAKSLARKGYLRRDAATGEYELQPISQWGRDENGLSEKDRAGRVDVEDADLARLPKRVDQPRDIGSADEGRKSRLLPGRAGEIDVERA